MALSIQQIIEQADRRTEKRASKELDLVPEFWMALNEFCLEKRFPWRKKTFFFNTQAAKQTYDLSSTADTGAVAPDFYEMKVLYRVDPNGSTSEITPMLSEDLLNTALENTIAAPPSMYYILPGTTQTLLFNAPMDSIRKIRGGYWALPDPILDSSIEVVPLVPPQLTTGLVVALERRLFYYLLGQEDPRSVQAEARYRRFVQLAAKMFKFTTNAQLEFAMQDQAVRAVDASTSGLDNQQISRSD
jgi:hypothetical protein